MLVKIISEMIYDIFLYISLHLFNIHICLIYIFYICLIYIRVHVCARARVCVCVCKSDAEIIEFIFLNLINLT